MLSKKTIISLLLTQIAFFGIYTTTSYANEEEPSQKYQKTFADGGIILYTEDSKGTVVGYGEKDGATLTLAGKCQKKESNSGYIKICEENIEISEANGSTSLYTYLNTIENNGTNIIEEGAYSGTNSYSGYEKGSREIVYDTNFTELSSSSVLGESTTGYDASIAQVDSTKFARSPRPLSVSVGRGGMASPHFLIKTLFVFISIYDII